MKDYDTKRHWVEYVSPRKKTYKGNVYILVGHWTGSMGEGIAIGFDALDRATVIGTPMAGLLGAISNFRLTETKIGFNFRLKDCIISTEYQERNLFPRFYKNIEETLEKAKEVAF
jgi:carboxyl-terminal processing protease